jgi:hypothetical protein
MPFFKSNANIFKDQGEYFESKWMDSNELVLPPTTDWTYDRELQIDDVDLWEVIHEGAFGIYAAWSPRAEFYMILPFWKMVDKGHSVETFYGIDAGLKTQQRAKELGITLPLNNYWVDDRILNT